ncbi:MAG: glycosyltransferase family 39 protein, partial [Thermodesulfovibrionales bacterium]|nr:glycosyltransferase family 39 protein [Thermodesulfovibrionales bacterium]
PLYSAYGVVMTIDPPFMFFWVLALYQMLRVLQRGSVMNWAVLGMIVGLGMLSKYTMAFFMICTVCWFVFSKDKRKYFLTPGPYAGVVAALLFFSPVIIWNAMNGWPTLLHTAGHVNVAGGFTLTPMRFLDFLGSQFGVVTPVLFVLMFISVLRARDDEKGKFLFWYSAPVFIFFILKSWQGKVEPNWGMMAYITGLIALSRDWFAGNAVLSRAKRGIVAIGFVMALALTMISLYAGDLGVPHKLDPSARMKGWAGAASAADIALKDLGEPVFIFSNTYQVASEMAFYMEGNPVTYNVKFGRRMNQYDLWPGIEDIDGVTGYNGLFVTMSERSLKDRISNAFRECEARKYDAKDDDRRYLRQYWMLLCKGFKGEFEEEESTDF